MTQPTTISIDGVDYIRADSAPVMAKNTDGLDCVLVRGDRSGLFIGYLKSRTGTEVELLDSRRIWYWKGAASPSQLALDGTSNPDGCKFPAMVPSHTILDAIEIMPLTEKARVSLYGVKIWAE